jgi:ribosomal protein L40E
MNTFSLWECRMAKKQTKKTKQPKQEARTFAKEAADINRIHEKLHASLRTSLAEAVEAGKILTAVKAELSHGQFMAWVEKNIKCSRKTTAGYMRLYENRAMLTGKGDLSIKNAYKLLPGNNGKAKSNVTRVTFEKEAEAGLKAESEPEPKGEPKAEPERPKPQLDPDKHGIPERLDPVFAEIERFEAFQQVLTTLKSQVTAARDANPDAWSQFNVSNFNVHIDNARSALKWDAPHIVCSYCRAQSPQTENCRACGGKGFLSRVKAQAVPKELRECS